MKPPVTQLAEFAQQQHGPGSGSGGGGSLPPGSRLVYEIVLERPVDAARNGGLSRSDARKLTSAVRHAWKKEWMRSSQLLHSEHPTDQAKGWVAR